MSDANRMSWPADDADLRYREEGGDVPAPSRRSVIQVS